jgi:hypothetical protein
MKELGVKDQRDAEEARKTEAQKAAEKIAALMGSPVRHR